jgi:hypothetical protein
MRKAQYEYVEVIGMFDSMGGMMTVSRRSGLRLHTCAKHSVNRVCRSYRHVRFKGWDDDSK